MKRNPKYLPLQRLRRQKVNIENLRKVIREEIRKELKKIKMDEWKKQVDRMYSDIMIQMAKGDKINARTELKW